MQWIASDPDQIGRVVVMNEVRPLGQAARSELEFMASVVPIVKMTPEGMTPVGTAFFVSALGLLIAARHSVDGFLPVDVLPGDHYGRPNERLFILVPSGDTPAAARHRTTMLITQIALEPGLSDVAILEVNMETYPAQVRAHFRPWPLAHHRPTTGEDCVVAGYADMKVGEFINATRVSPDLEWQQHLRFAEGVVGNVHPGGRDSLLAPHPCFEVLAATSGGMSGGPVFTNNGISGVLSRGWTFESEGPPNSLSALIASCYHLEVEVNLGVGRRTYKMSTLIKEGHVVSEGPMIQRRMNEDRVEILWP
jgi:hypothetical protein